MSEETAAPDIDTARLIRRTIVGLAALILAAAVVGLVLRDPLVRIAEAFVDWGGLLGLFAGVLVIDTIPFTTHEPLLLFAWSGGLPFGAIFVTASTASVLAGWAGWAMGRVLGRAPVVHRALERWRVGPFLRRYGVWAVAMAAITPFPYALATWGAGASGVSFAAVAKGSLVRVPKVLLYFSLIALGWSVGG